MVASVIISVTAKIIHHVILIMANAIAIVGGWEKLASKNALMAILEQTAERNVLIICHQRPLAIM